MRRNIIKSKRINWLWAVLLLVPVFVLLPDSHAFAWGPGVHMVTGNWLLQNLMALPAEVAASIMSHPGQFLYGILSPDIFIGKGSLNKKGHSHNWQTGLLLLRLADTPEQKAYAYGYLSHLSADTVAHNVFVPQSSDMAVGSGRLAHVYLEMQADRALKWDSKDALAVFSERPSAASAALLKKTMRQTAWSFWMKKFLFRQSIFLGGLPSWRSAMGFLDSVMVGQEGVVFAEQMLVVSTRAMVSVLQDVKYSPVRTLDPIGAEALDGFRGQSLNILQTVVNNFFPGLMDKQWRQSPFYRDDETMEGNKSMAEGVAPDEGKKKVVMHGGSADSLSLLLGGQEYGDGFEGVAPPRTPGRSDNGKDGFLAQGGHDEEKYEFLADMADEVSHKMKLLSSIDSGSPIVEHGFTLPDVLRDLPPVCIP